MNKAHVLRERGDSSGQPFQHDEITTTLTLARQTRICMPMLDEETIFTDLFVLDNDVPTNMIDSLLERVNAKSQIDNIWLADTTIPDGLTEEDDEATIPPINASWKSPFGGMSVEEAFKFLATIPLDKSLNRTYIIVLNRSLYEQKKWVLLYRIDEEGEITCVPCAAHMCMVYIDSYGWDRWSDHMEAWCKRGSPIF